MRRNETDKPTETLVEPSPAEALRQAIARLEGECSEMDSEYRRLSAAKHSTAGEFAAWQPDSERLSYLRETLPGLKSKIDTLRDKLKLADDVANFERAAAEAPERSEAARTAAESAEQRRDELAVRADKLRQRAESIQAENGIAEARAAENESAAAQVYARAVSSGNTKVESPPMPIC
jgi:chromosome segregation ATPase